MKVSSGVTSCGDSSSSTIDTERTIHPDNPVVGNQTMEPGSIVEDAVIAAGLVLDRRIGDYLEDLGSDEVARYLLSDKVLIRYGRLMDIVTAEDERTMCFTKG